jgi:hypothetical protein
MIDMHILGGALLALAVVVAAAIALSVAMLVAPSVTQPGQAPRGGTRRAVPPQPLPDDDHARDLDEFASELDDYSRELVLR